MPPNHHSDTCSMVADIGGTNTRVALAEGKSVLKDTIRKYRNADYPELETILKDYIRSQNDAACAGACVAVAGPVHNGVGELTNLSWRIDGNAIARATGAETIFLLNDLQAQGHALHHIAQINLRTVIRHPEAAPGAARLVIGVGTGFNATPVYHTGRSRYAAPAEAGHANMPVRSDADLRLARYVDSAHGFPSVEDVLSGRGLERIHSWLGHESGDPQEIDAASIMESLRRETSPRAEKAARIFARLLGSAAGNLALNTLPFGGIYLSGGVARAFAPYLQRFGFVEAFRDKGRFSDFMDNFGVSVIEDDFAALAGCAEHLSDSA